MAIDRRRSPAQRSIITLTLTQLIALAAQARAQEPPPPPPPQPPPASAEDEARQLREAAEAETAPSAPAGADEGARLRGAAAADVQDQGPLYNELLSAFYAVANRANSFNPRMTVVGDFTGRLALGAHETVIDGVRQDDRVSLDEVELDLRADIDPYSKGVVILSFEEESPGQYVAGIEEAYFTLETLPAGFRAQIGRFRVPFGRQNAIHTHDLPQTTRPLALRDMFGEEGLSESGAVVQWLAPGIPIELTLAGMNGENERILAGAGSKRPSFLGRGEAFFQLTDRAFLSLGTSYLFGWNDAPDPLDKRGEPMQETHLWGADALFKWQWNEYRSVVLQGELYALKKELPASPKDYGFGAYGLVQVQPSERWYLGLRGDYSNYDEGRRDHEQWALSAWVSYYTTEFLRFRLGIEHRERQSTNGGDPDLDTLFGQITFVFGSHPAEPFWVNR